jgi:hypothetical protein
MRGWVQKISGGALGPLRADARETSETKACSSELYMREHLLFRFLFLLSRKTNPAFYTIPE